MASKLSLVLAAATAACILGAFMVGRADAQSTAPTTGTKTGNDTAHPAIPDKTGAAPAAEAVKAASAVRHPGLDPFKANCASCHTVGAGQLVGPDLAGVKDRTPSRAWLLEYVRNPAAMIAKDAYAKQLRAKYPLDMSPFAHLGDAAINDILDFIDAGGPGLATAKLRESTPQDIETGRALFTGETRFASGAPACMSCHEILGSPGFGGGSLASSVGAMNPSLTAAATRNGGETGLRAALASPQFTVMRDVFARTPLNEEETIALSAYLADTARKMEPAPERNAFALWGVLGALAALVLLDLIWIRRFRNVRRTLVGESS